MSHPEQHSIQQHLRQPLVEVSGVYWHNTRTGLWWLLALLPVYAYGLYLYPVSLLSITVAAWVILFLVGEFFVHTTNQSVNRLCPDHVKQAMLFALLLPVQSSYWQVSIVVLFGSVFGERIFGGRGFSFLNPVTLGLSFYLFSHAPEMDSIAANLTPFWLLIPAFVLLSVSALVCWRFLIAFLLGVLSFSLLSGDFSPGSLNSLAGVTGVWLIILFLAADPASGGASRPARWFHGALAAALLMTLLPHAESVLSGAVYATLIANLSVPLIDFLVAQVDSMRRRQRRKSRLTLSKDQTDG